MGHRIGHEGGRNPSIGMSGEFDYRNNVIFNWRHRTMDSGDETSLLNVINNHYKPSPATNENMLRPDEWEKKYGLDPAGVSDGCADSDQDGYTNVEEYLNGTNPRERIDYRNLGNNIDTIS